jgi:membrane protein DedA with SNARE-associated domain
VQHLISSVGYAAIFLLMVAESACIPLPSELTMPFAGALAATGRLDLVTAIVVGVLGNLVGSYVAWAVGKVGGRPLLERFGRLVRLDQHDLRRAERWFERRGELTVLVSRLIPVVRTFISLPAGVADMAPVRFGVYTILGCIPWTVALAVAGYELGDQWKHVYHGFNTATIVIAVVVVVAIVAALLVFFRSRWTGRRSAAAAVDPPAEG